MNKAAFILTPLLLLITSCSSLFLGEDYDNHDGWAQIGDHVTGSKYEIVLVDGQPATRREHGQMVTVVPVVVVPEGDHILSIRSIENQAANRDKAMTELAVSVKKNARYRLLNVDGELALVILEHGQFDD